MHSIQCILSAKRDSHERNDLKLANSDIRGQCKGLSIDAHWCCPLHYGACTHICSSKWYHSNDIGILQKLKISYIYSYILIYLFVCKIVGWQMIYIKPKINGVESYKGQPQYIMWTSPNVLYMNLCWEHIYLPVDGPLRKWGSIV